MVLSALLLLAVAVGTQGITTQGIPTCADYPKGHPQSCKGCYSRSSSVVLDDGEVIKMEDLKVGQAVQVTDPEGKPGTSKFVGWLEKHRFNTNLVKLTTESGNVLTMTGGLSSPSSMIRILFRKPRTVHLEIRIHVRNLCQKPLRW